MKNWIGFYTLSHKEIKRILRIWRQTLVPPIITTALYFLIFGQLLGSRLGEINGANYTQFIAPGLIMMSAIIAAYNNAVSSFFLSKFLHNIEELLVSPLSTHTIIWGYVSGSAIRGILVGALVALVSLCFVSYHIYSWGIIITILLFTIIVFALGGLINAIFAKSFDDIGIIPTFVLTPLTYLGGVFYSLDNLPPFWQQISQFNPLVYMINGFRYGFLGTTDVSLHCTFFVLLALSVSLYFIAYYLIEKGVGLRS